MPAHCLRRTPKNQDPLEKTPGGGKFLGRGAPRMMGGGVWRETFALFPGAAETFSRVPYGFGVFSEHFIMSPN